ncbi:VapE domain-containing protein [Synechococcus sp. CCY9202]|uniref:VapE domain-containing protein n=1 Tax=Synechococcus sp. CCY9202 TaxID=174698 RepID=UPI002B206D75|nr:VapE domain-containing protein [Synechococcus sp. CCY9202]MEA5421952.1 VapE domain-containing protein [Synechococcus sp. CCY9202]
MQLSLLPDGAPEEIKAPGVHSAGAPEADAERAAAGLPPLVVPTWEHETLADAQRAARGSKRKAKAAASTPNDNGGQAAPAAVEALVSAEEPAPPIPADAADPVAAALAELQHEDAQLLALAQQLGHGLTRADLVEAGIAEPSVARLRWLAIKELSPGQLLADQQERAALQQSLADGVARDRAERLALLTPEHRAYLRGRAGGAYSEALIDWLVLQGFIRSITFEQAITEFSFTRAKETQTGGLLVCHNPKAKHPHYQLRCDVAPFDEERGRYAKYLMQTGAGERLAVWDPSGLRGPDGQQIGQARISTEGFFDSAYCTLVLGIPCMAITAPSHLRVLALPDHLKTYVGDCDQWMAPSLLPTLVRGCVSKGLRLTRLPLVEAHLADYLKPHRELPGDAKGGMEELGLAHGVDGAQQIVSALVSTAATPGEYLRGEIQELGRQGLGLSWPEQSPSINNLIAAMADAYPNSATERDALKAQLVKATGVQARTVNDGVRERLARRQEADLQERMQQREQARSEALARGETPEPFIDREEPTHQQLQLFIAYAHQVRFNELTRTPEMDGNAITDVKLTYQVLAAAHGINANKAAAEDALLFVAKSNPYNPVAEYLEGLRADEAIAPLEEAVVYSLFGLVPGDALSRELLKRSLAGTALRGLQPGSKFDACPILRGRQGNGKTESLRALVSDAWYDGIGDYGSSNQLALSGWAVMAKANASWIFELGEVERLTQGRCQSAFKDWLTERIAKYAEKNQPLATEHPRRFVTWGTTNEQELLNDETGTRRFWIIECPGTLRWREIGLQRDRIWKAALLWLEAGTETWLNPDTAEGASALAAAAERGLAATFTDPWVAVLLEYLAAAVTADGKRSQAERLALAQSGAWETVHPEGDGVKVLRLRYVPVGHRTSEQVALFVALSDLYAALDVKPAQQSKGTSARVNKVMGHHQIRGMGWAACQSKKAGARGYAQPIGGEPGDGPDSGPDSGDGPDSGNVPKIPGGDSDLGLVPILLEEGGLGAC